jgi:hypothetical protein
MDNSTTENFKIIKIIYGSLIIGVVVFLLFTVYTIPMRIFEYNDGSEFVFLVPLFFILGVFLSSFLFNRSISKIVKTDNLFQKLTKYQSANIMRGAPLEGAGLMAVVATFTTSNYYYLVFAVLAIVLMLMNFPSKYKFENTVELSLDEKNRFEKM